MPGPVDAVLHFASPASPVDYLELPIQTLKVGSLGTHNALGLAKAKGARFFLASTSEVYGDPKVHPQPETYWGHVNPIGPRGVYDEAKRFAEAMTMAYHRDHGLDVRIVRIFNTYGPAHARPTTAGWSRTSSCRRSRASRSPSTATAPRPAASATSTTRSAGFLALLDGPITGPINIGNHGEFTMLELADLVLEVTGSSSEIVYRAAAGRRPAGSASPTSPCAREPAGLGAEDRAPRGPRSAPPTVLPRARCSAAGRRLSRADPSELAVRRARDSASSRLAQVPVEGEPQALVEGVRASKPNCSRARLASTRPAGLAVGLGGVPPDLALEADELDDDLDEVADRQLAGRRRG